jgi:hypothetical protein
MPLAKAYYDNVDQFCSVAEVILLKTSQSGCLNGQAEFYLAAAPSAFSQPITVPGRRCGPITENATRDGLSGV